MSSVNKAFILGNVTNDPESRQLPNSTFCGFGVATNKKWTSNGERKEKASFHTIETYAGLADVCAKFVTKGMTVLIEGEIEYKEWDKEGVKHYKTVIKADKVHFLGGKGEKKNDNNSGGGFGDDEPSFGNW